MNTFFTVNGRGQRRSISLERAAEYLAEDWQNGGDERSQGELLADALEEASQVARADTPCLFASRGVGFGDLTLQGAGYAGR